MRPCRLLRSGCCRYATILARHLYAELAQKPGQSVAQALAQARYLTEDTRRWAAGNRLVVPEFGVVTLLTAGGDGPLRHPTASAVPLTITPVVPGGGSVRDLPVGALIGRRPQRRTAMAALLRTPAALDRHGYSAEVQLTGIGGIGKTALAGRIMTRLRGDGWMIAVHEGAWNPTALISITADALTQAIERDNAHASGLARTRDLLADPNVDDPNLGAGSGLACSGR